MKVDRLEFTRAGSAKVSLRKRSAKDFLFERPASVAGEFEGPGMKKVENSAGGLRAQSFSEVGKHPGASLGNTT